MRLIARLFSSSWLLLFLIEDIISAPNNDIYAEVNMCNLSRNLIQEINSHALPVSRIIHEALNGSFKGTTWDELSTFVDKFGPRLSGSKVLEDSIDYVLNKSVHYGLENVHGEPAQVPHWIRGLESATLLLPRYKTIDLLGLGTSVGTPPEGITAYAIIVNSFAELKARAKEVPGKIVVYNQEFISYAETVQYRSRGATEASALGAVAALVRSVTPFSLYTAHTGMQEYGPNVTKIPVACITAEDASLLKRLEQRGNPIKIKLKMGALNLPDTTSRNVIAEIRGSTNPEKVVVVSGHIDSWDVGQGAMDDGGGAFISWSALRLLHQLGYRPRRTIRMIMWTAEEFGLIGAAQYTEAHKSENRNLQFVMESDFGTFRPVGLSVSGNNDVQCIVQSVMQLLAPLGKMKTQNPDEGPDISFWTHGSGIPGASLWTQNDKYFYYHHSNADTMLVEDPESLDMNAALFAAVAYVLADISVDLPR